MMLASNFFIIVNLGYGIRNGDATIINSAARERKLIGEILRGLGRE